MPHSLKKRNSLVPVQFRKENSDKEKTYLVNVNWSIDEFMEYMKHQIRLDAEYFGFDIEQQEEIEFIPCLPQHYYFQFSSIFRLIDYFYDDERNKPLKPSPKLVQYYFREKLPSLIIRKKTIQTIETCSFYHYPYPYKYSPHTKHLYI